MAGMIHIALKMLIADRAKFTGLLLGIAFTSFLVTFAGSYFAGFMTRGFALISENSADVWVMDPAVSSVEETINLSDATLDRVRSVEGVGQAMPLALANVDVRFPNGRFQSFQVIGVNGATLTGAPLLDGQVPTPLRMPDTVMVDDGGTSGKLQTPLRVSDRWPYEGVRLEVPTRELAAGDELLINGHRVRVIGRSHTLSRFPPRPLIYTSFANASHFLPQELHRITFIQVKVQAGVAASQLAKRIQQQTGLRARTSADFKADTVRWYLVNSEDVGDMAAMLTLAMTVGFGVTGIMLYMFTYENLRQYAVLKAMGAMQNTLLKMILVQAGVCSLLGVGLGLGSCVVIGELVSRFDYPFRMMWFTPIVGVIGVMLVSLTAAAISLRPVMKLQPAVVFSGR